MRYRACIFCVILFMETQVVWWYNKIWLYLPLYSPVMFINFIDSYKKKKQRILFEKIAFLEELAVRFHVAEFWNTNRISYSMLFIYHIRFRYFRV